MKFSYRLFLIIVLLSIISLSASAQSRNLLLSGKITDATSGEPLPGVTISVDGTQVGTITDAEGKYTLQYVLPRSKHTVSVVVRSMGYKTIARKIDQLGKQVINFPLQHDYLNLEGVTVTATRTEKTLSCAPIVTKLISNSDIQRVNAPSVKDLLEYEIPGVEFSNHGGQTSIKMQGFESGYILFLVDGEELSGQNNGNIDLQRISPDQIERIEVVKGAGSALYGSNAIAGVVNIITKTSRKPFSLFASLGFNQPGHYSSFAEIGINRNGIRSMTSASYSDAKGYHIYAQSKSDSTYVPRNKVWRIGEKLQWSPSKSFKLNANLGFTNRKQFNSIYENQINRTINGHLSGVFNPNDHSSWTLSTNQDISIRSVEFPLVHTADSTAYKNYLTMVRLQNDRVCGDNLNINVGVEYHAEGMKSFQISGLQKMTWAKWGVLFGQAMHEIHEKFNMIYGARLDWHSAYGVNVSPKLGFFSDLGNFKIRGGYAWAFKAPTIMELYFNWYHENGGGFKIFGNPNLKPERAHQLNLGAEYTKGRLSLSASAQYTWFRHKILQTQDEQYNIHYHNATGASPVFGVEFNAIWKPIESLRLSANYSYVHEKSNVDIVGQTISVASARPHSLNGQISYVYSSKKYLLDISLMGKFHSGFDTNVIAQDFTSKEQKSELVHYQSYFVSRITLNQKLFDKYTLSLGVDNIFDYRTDHVSMLAPITPGRSFFAKFIVNL